MNRTANSLVEGMERLGLIASRIRKNEGKTPQIEIDIILEELRNLYMVALQLESDSNCLGTYPTQEGTVDAKKVAEEKRLAEEAAAKKAAEEKRLAEEAAAKKAAEEKRLAEEAAAKKAAEEKRLAEEAAAKKAAEEKRLAEEAAKKAAEERARKIVDDEFHPTFAPATPETPSEPIMEPQLEKLEGNPNDELFAEQPEGKQKEPSLLDLFKNEKGGE